MNAMLVSTAIWLLLCMYSDAEAQPATTVMPPNIVIFLVDDLGWNQVGYHAKPSGNDEIQTPHIDHYATEVGIELDRGYMTPWCGPSRAATMTGRTNVYNFNVSSLISTFDDNIGYVAGLQPGTKTLATALKEYGKSINVTYSTWFNGKYGIGVRRRDRLNLLPYIPKPNQMNFFRFRIVRAPHLQIPHLGWDLMNFEDFGEMD